eukprot:CAMPEP_0177664484 /NCGR_PEP_ID=MMETSP0447-20121125/20519_1 /TAXON_ID=0 /ORGANISM="Stygamoeba regulata, Strain BSH-02190019" /LENGTH=80 /DNA_ID=CAMNT_0019170461 /DNA_START=346 /DNA_END=588 /DNA_ORIENTATION=+
MPPDRLRKQRRHPPPAPPSRHSRQPEELLGAGELRETQRVLVAQHPGDVHNTPHKPHTPPGHIGNEKRAVRKGRCMPTER